MKEKIWCVYLLECQDGSYYTGVTNDLKNRLRMHKSGKGSKYVTSRGFSHLISSKECKDQSDALKTEYYIKQLSKNEKINFFIL
jgi:putative endonuclease